jgi:xylulokinase
MKYLLGIDIGTTNVKATLYDANFNQVAVAGEEYPTQFPQRGWAEQDSEHWWAATVAALRKITGEIGTDTKNIKGICVSSQAPAVLPLDGDGHPLRPALIWMDRRSEPQCDILRRKIGQTKINAITGNRIDPYFALPKILWLKDNEPDAYARTWKYLQVNGFINYRLIGEVSCDRVHASLTGLYDIHAKTWSTEICNTLGLNVDLLPPIFDSTDIIGVVNSAAASLTGLAEGIPVVAGNVDASSAALESGVIGRGEAAEMTGTSTCFMLGCNAWPDSINLVSIHHAVPGHDLLIAPISSTGASLKWYRDQIGCCSGDDKAQYDRDPYRYMDQMAENSNSRSKLIFLPYMAGERAPLWDSDARGMFFGLTHSTSRGQMIRSILEGSVFALKHNILEAEKSGQAVQALSSVGGGSNSRVWLQIKSTILDMPVRTLKHASSGAFGNALLAGYAVGIVQDIREFVSDNIKVNEVFYPEKELVPQYQKMFEIYRNIYEHTKTDFHDLTSIEFH